MATNNKGIHACVSHACMPDAYMQKWCVRVACALVAYLCTALQYIRLGLMVWQVICILRQ